MKLPQPIVTITVLAVMLGIACDNNTSEQASKQPIDYLRDIAPMNPDGTVNAVIEIPAGSLQKWETNKKTGQIEWSTDHNGTPRTIHYLPYPANYGMVPQTWLPPSEGGDNDPIDIFIIGESLPRGSVVVCRVIGVIHLIDRGELDDKLIAVTANSPFEKVSSLREFELICPDCVTQLSTWLLNYKATGKTEISATGDELVAADLLQKAIAAFPRFNYEAQ